MEGVGLEGSTEKSQQDQTQACGGRPSRVGGKAWGQKLEREIEGSAVASL